MQIKYVDYTLAEMTKDEVRIHKDLQDFDIDLYKHCLLHELNHQDKTLWGNLVHDLKEVLNFKYTLKIWRFYLKYPKIFFNMAKPIQRNRETGELELNLTLTIFYFVDIISILFFLY